jgi:hypothetical protein
VVNPNFGKQIIVSLVVYLAFTLIYPSLLAFVILVQLLSC